MLAYGFDVIPFVLLVLILAFTVHEFAHAYSAYKFGDSTAYNEGRVTLNPRVHLDVFGTIVFILVGFGWAKPVPVRRSNFKKPRLMGVIVSAVGPLSNLVMAFIGLLILYLLWTFGGIETWSTGTQKAALLFLVLLVQINIVLFILNLLPVPPLDGYRILEDVLPVAGREKMRQYEQWGMIVLLLLVFIEPLYRVTLGPIFALQYDIIAGFNTALSSIFGFRIPVEQLFRVSGGL
ncbi:site-2 protease family protein [Paenibacillus sp. FJAT-26967]|uniref:site-2 protease family protein n=1 Tax=Paenibacillus sp. FJAT-26967 TaxID=1729690 RepID=UPI000838B493|nr:site-2 protease family protein [Paenibacillus sp. FJAT-26967]